MWILKSVEIEEIFTLLILWNEQSQKVTEPAWAELFQAFLYYINEPTSLIKTEPRHDFYLLTSQIVT